MEESHSPSLFHSIIGFIVAAVIAGPFLFIMNFLLNA